MRLLYKVVTNNSSQHEVIRVLLGGTRTSDLTGLVLWVRTGETEPASLVGAVPLTTDGGLKVRKQIRLFLLYFSFFLFFSLYLCFSL